VRTEDLPWGVVDPGEGDRFPVIEEYARHSGHADLTRERIDGMTGD